MLFQKFGKTKKRHHVEDRQPLLSTADSVRVAQPITLQHLH